MHTPTVLSNMANNFRSFSGTSEMYPGISGMELLLWGRILKLFRVLIFPGASLGLVHSLLYTEAGPTGGGYSLREVACFLTLTPCLAKGSFREADIWPRLWLGMILLTQGSQTSSGMHKHILTNAPWSHQRGGSRCGGWGIWGGGLAPLHLGTEQANMGPELRDSRCVPTKGDPAVQTGTCARKSDR